MKAHGTKPTWTDVKAKLTGFERAGLIGLVHDLYLASKNNQAFLHARFAMGGDVLKPYKATIDRWLWPDVFKNQDTSVVKAKKAISDYKKAVGQSEGLAELMVFYCERAAGFSNEAGLQDEGYFDALARMFEQALKSIAASPEEARPALWARLDMVRRISHNFGYGVGDAMGDLLAEHALAFMQSCEELGVPVAMEISRSGRGAHAWVFFASRVSARDARRLGTAIISHTCSRTRQLKLESYDRLFPNQDTMPKGGFGNLIALPLQKWPRESGRSVFVDAELHPYPDQWAFLASVQPMAAHDIEPAILRATGGVHPLDVTFIDDEDLATPWKRESKSTNKLVGPMPKSLSVALANFIYFDKAQLPQALANRLIRLAAFQNPEFYKAQAMRMSVWDKPRVIGNAENCSC